MEQMSHTISDLAELKALLASTSICASSGQAQSILVQVFSAKTDPTWLRGVASVLTEALPHAVIVGVTTVGEIARGCTLTGQTVVGFTFFAKSTATAIVLSEQPGQEVQMGAELGRRIDQVGSDVAGVLLLATTASLDAWRVLQGLAAPNRRYPIFGGGAADYATMADSMVLAGTEVYRHGVVAVVLSGSELHVDVRTYLGWRPLSKSMTVTEVDGMLVKQVDGKPAFDLYRHYLDIPDDSHFFLNAIEFPFLRQRNGECQARVPVAVDPQGSIQFIADVAEGDTFQIGYGDPSLILADAESIRSEVRSFAPQAVFLYTCSCRRFLMQQDAELETLPFEDIAPTIGFYTYGEFQGAAAEGQLLNATMVAVGLREGEPAQAKTLIPRHSEELLKTGEKDPFSYQHTRIISRLMYFIGAITEELEQANHKLLELSLTDSLTKINNRVKLDAALAEETARAARYEYAFSVILLDIDHFKKVNDTYGHIVGDAVLVQLAGVLKTNLRENDTLGRWGGEEFMLILPHADLERARQVGEKLRLAIAAETFPIAGHRTSSFGITSYCPGDNVTKLLARADEALYIAKNLGRNRVQTMMP